MPLRLRLLPWPADRRSAPGAWTELGLAERSRRGGAGEPAEASQLIVGPAQERAVELPDETREIRIGRRPDIEVPLPYPDLSGLHARLTRTDGGWQIEDLGSTNGTHLNGEPLIAHRPRPIAPGAQIALGPVLVIFDGLAPSVRGSERTASIARRLVSDLLAGSPDAGAPVLAIVDGVPAGPPLRLSVIDRRYLIGRGESCDMRLSSDEVSREHAAVIRRWDGVVVEDLGSKNGISVNDQTASARELRARDGDLVRIGPATLRLSDPADRYLREIEAQSADQPDPPRDRRLNPPPAARAAPRPPPSPALRAAIAIATGVLLVVAIAVTLLALGS